MQFASPLPIAAAGLLVAASAGALDYAPYESVLSAHVSSDGFVDYAGLVRQPRELNQFVRGLARLDPSTYDGWSQPQQLAFWMNAYNALTLKAVVDHYPVNSIKDIGNLFVSVWDKLTFTVMGADVTLNHIEHDILRKQFAEPRIHMAINCASIGCPPLAATPLRAATLDQQFDTLTSTFLANPDKFIIDRAKGVVRLSPIFKWFGDDFITAYGAEHARPHLSARENAVLNFVAGYVSPSDQTYLREQRFKVRYLDYDWNLNRQ